MAIKDEESQPLLSDQRYSATKDIASSEPKLRSKWTILPHISFTDPKFRFLPLLGCLIVLVNEGEYYFKQIGYFRAVEALYCIEYFQQHDPSIATLGRGIPEKMCKLDPIQKKVATANGIVMLVRMASSFIGTVLVGYLADRLGRRFALIMHKVGTLIYTCCVFLTYVGYPKIPIWVSFCGGLGGIIGANFDLNLALLLAAYTDTMTSSTQVATYFFITTSMQYVGQVAFPLAAGRAINLDGQGGTPEVSLLISLGMALAGLCITVFFVPETMKFDATGADNADDTSNPHRQCVTIRFKSYWANFQHSVRSIGTSDTFILAVSMFLATTAIKSVDWLGLIQYPVIKFGWKYNQVRNEQKRFANPFTPQYRTEAVLTNISQSTYAMAFQALIYIFVYFILLPLYTKIGSYCSISPPSTSLLVMLLSVIFLSTGSTLLGLSTNAYNFIAATCVYTLGAGMPSVMQAYIASLVEKSALGRLLAIISLFQVGGKLTASAVGPVIINAGIDSGNERLKGAIFFFAAVVFLFAASGLGVVALRARRTKADE